MKCLNCEEREVLDSVLCDVCSEELDAELTDVTSWSSKKFVSSHSLEISPDGILWLVSDETVSYLHLSKDQWSVLTEFLKNKVWK